jgi:hypothetical protein
MHKVRGNYTSCIGRSSENICSSTGGTQLKGKRGSKQDETQAHFTLRVWADVQSKSSIPIGSKVEIGPKGFTRRVKTELEKKIYNLLKFLINPNFTGFVLGRRLEKGYHQIWELNLQPLGQRSSLC